MVTWHCNLLKYMHPILLYSKLCSCISEKFDASSYNLNFHSVRKKNVDCINLTVVANLYCRHCIVVACINVLLFI